VSVDSETGKSRVVLVASLYMNPGRRAEFDEFETAAARIMRRYGGVIERRIGIAPTDENQPDEVHVVMFPDRTAFERYRADAELQGLAELRQKAIRLTTIWFGGDLTIFGEAGTV
jgi:hypothetical protein